MDWSGEYRAPRNDADDPTRPPLPWRARIWLWLAGAGVPLASLLPVALAGFPPKSVCNGPVHGPTSDELVALDRWAAAGLVVSILLILVSAVGAHRTVPGEPIHSQNGLTVAAMLLVAGPLIMTFTPYGYLALLTAGPLLPVLVLQPFAAGYIASRNPPSRILGYTVAAEMALLAWWSSWIWEKGFC